MAGGCLPLSAVLGTTTVLVMRAVLDLILAVVAGSAIGAAAWASRL